MYEKRSHTISQWDLYLECKISSTYENQSKWYITLIKEKILYVIISKDSYKIFAKIQFPFMIKKKKTQQLWGKMEFLWLKNGLLWKIHAIIRLKCEYLKAFLLESETGHRCLFSLLLFSWKLEVLTTSISKGIKVIQTEKEEVKITICK